ncbi:sigma 54-interacting transcriptional regulator [Sandaracinus amylolyticus]|nr:sigma 54-interacting transcriptional regulator [Sandaracinus amylolyticus]
MRKSFPLRLLEPPRADVYPLAFGEPGEAFVSKGRGVSMQQGTSGSQSAASSQITTNATHASPHDRPVLLERRNFSHAPPVIGSAPNACAGRESEIAKLMESYRRIAQHRDRERLVLLQGPGGIGKSRILGELRGRIRLEGGVVLEGRCEPGRAFGPFAEIVDRALRFLDEVGVVPSSDLDGLACRAGCHRLWHQHGGPEPETSSAIDPNGAPPEIAAFEKRLRFFDAIHQLLRDVATVRAPVLILHHLERADRGTLELLSFLLDLAGDHGSFAGQNEPTALRMMVVASLRDDVAPAHPEAIETLRGHDAAERVPVGALDAQGVRAFLTSEEAIARVIERTGGNPELIELLLEADPLTPRARIERRLARLTPIARELAGALAVHARPASLETLAAIAGVPIEAAARSELPSFDLLTRSIVDGHVLFAFERENDRETCYQLFSPRERRDLHARCIDVCSARLDLQEAVRHAIATGDFARASDLAVAAAASLAARHAHAEAAALLESLLQANSGAGKGATELPLVIREELADLYRIAGNYRGALVHARAVRDALPEDPAAARRVGYLLTVAGEFDAAAEPLEAARRLATARVDAGLATGAEVAEVEAQLAELGYQQGNYDAAREWSEAALERAREAGALRIEIHARNTLGKLALAQKNPAVAAELFEQNRVLAARSGLGHQEAQAHTNLGVAMLLRRELGAAEQACKRAIEVATRASDTRDRAIATENLAVLAHLARDYRRALSHYHVAVGLLKRLGNRAMLGRVANNLGELYLSLGDRARARALSDLAAHVSGTSGPPLRTAQRLRLRGRIEAADGNVGLARQSFESALLAFRSLGDARAAADAQLEVAKLALADGDVPKAREILASLPVEDAPQRAAEVAIVAADLERAAGGETVLSARRAVELAEKAGDDELLLPALVRFARALGDAGDLSHAARVLERAQDVDKKLGANVPEEALAAWQERPARIELMQVQAKLASAWAATYNAGGRHDSVPPPRALAPRGRPVIAETGASDPRFEKWRKRYPNIAGSSTAVASVMSVLDKVSNSDAIVLIRGESGTGKELIAEAIHNNSARATKPIVKVNCAALVETLLLSELFGHEKGAFTGAQSRKKGRFELADGGTIFLDEIGDISPKTQVALLRVLQEREFERVGGTQPIRVDVRIVAATHRDLERMVREGTFREDLYYRLRGVTLEMPPLRRRLDDLPELCGRLLQRIAEERDETAKRMSSAALDLLGGHRWPGNVRELENVLRSATLFADGEELVPEDFAAFADTFQAPDPEVATLRAATTTSAGGTSPGTMAVLGSDSVRDDASSADGEDAPIEMLVYERVRGGATSLFEMKKMLERECIVRALEETNGNITRAAALLGMKRPRLSQLVKEYELGDLGK